MITLPVRKVSSLKKLIAAHPESFYRYLVKEIRKGVNANATHVEFIRFGHTSATVGAVKESWPNLLREAMEHFSNKELYEDALVCRKILDMIELANLIASV